MQDQLYCARKQTCAKGQHNESTIVRACCHLQAVALQAMLTTAGVDAIEHVHEEAVNDVQDFIVVLKDGHLQIQAGELAQMAMREGLLCPAQQPHTQHIHHAMHVSARRKPRDLSHQ